MSMPWISFLLVMHMHAHVMYKLQCASIKPHEYKGSSWSSLINSETSNYHTNYLNLNHIPGYWTFIVQNILIGICLLWQRAVCGCWGFFYVVRQQPQSKHSKRFWLVRHSQPSRFHWLLSSSHDHRNSANFINHGEQTTQPVLLRSLSWSYGYVQESSGMLQIKIIRGMTI